MRDVNSRESNSGEGSRPSVFDGVPPDELDALLATLQRRSFRAGATVIAEGDQPNELYVVQSGRADVLVSDRRGKGHRVGQIKAGATLGEMSLFTGQPAVGTVRATEDIEMLVMSGSEFEALAERHPRIYRNLGTILSERLARTNRLAIHDTQGRLGLLRDWGAPPELVFAFASSVAWHTRAPTLVLLAAEDPPELLVQHADDDARPGAHVRILGSLQELRSYSLAGQVDELFRRYEHVFVLLPGGESPELATARMIDLAGRADQIPPRNGAPAGRTILGWTAAPARPRPDRDGIVRVPPLERSDLDALRNGFLPSSTPAGRALGWMARDFAGLKVGLALGAGSLLGYAHFGVLEVLDRIGLEADYLAGTSVGAAAAGLRAYGFSPRVSADVLDRCGDTLFRPTVPIKSLLSARALRRFLASVTSGQRIEDLPVPLAMVAADIETRQEVLFKSGLLWTATLASISIPGVYPARRVDGHTVVDGGVLNPVPTSVVAGMGADVVLAVRLSSIPLGREIEAVAVESLGPVPSALSVILSSLEIMQSHIQGEPPQVTTVTIAPEFGNVSGARLRQFKAGRRFVEAGVAAAEDALPRIHAALPWLRERS